MRRPHRFGKYRPWDRCRRYIPLDGGLIVCHHATCHWLNRITRYPGRTHG